ncbi:pantetheine-phosphate adenylyltransferase [Acholeplasma sp. OttesenSCG-928-E16]|nr:pantetheine-phosphate adenylyltransferase [Acholeplasma sp. OttesenSCG-928-E16]
MKVGLYSGSFDPITNGHLDIIKRSAALFDKVVVLIGINIEKKYMFSLEERKKMVSEACMDFKNVTIDCTDLLTVEYSKKHNINFLIRSIRNSEDYSVENKLSYFNKELDSNLETIFLLADEKYRHISSSSIKELHAYGQDISKYVPYAVLKYFK